MNIEDIQVGNYISSINHKNGTIERRMVINTSKKKAPKYLYDFNEFSCTENHPIYIHGIGYCIAKEIYFAYISHILMCYLYALPIFKYLYKLWKGFSSGKSKNNLFGQMRFHTKEKTPGISRNKLFELWG